MQTAIAAKQIRDIKSAAAPQAIITAVSSYKNNNKNILGQLQTFLAYQLKQRHRYF